MNEYQRYYYGCKQCGKTVVVVYLVIGSIRLAFYHILEIACLNRITGSPFMFVLPLDLSLKA